MSSGFDIEQIVQEVLRRLTVGGAPGAAGMESESGDYAAKENVVTLETLRNRLEGVRRIVVRQSAVVTPAVRDELRSRNIELVRTRSSARTDREVSGETALLCVQLSSDWDGLITMLERPLGVTRCADDDAVNEVTTLLNRVQQVICLTELPARLTCLANRDAQVRAACVDCVDQVREARRELDANVWVIDPRRQHRFETRNLVRHICS